MYICDICGREFESEPGSRATTCPECMENAEIKQKEDIYQRALNLESNKCCYMAIRQYEKIPGYKDSEERIANCRRLAEESASETGNVAELAKARSEASFRKRKKRKKIITVSLISLLTILILGTVGTILTIKYVIPPLKYDTGMKLLHGGKYAGAYECLKSVSDYKDAGHFAAVARTRALAAIGITGSGAVYGRFEQDDIPENGFEPLQWIVLEIKDNRALLLSKYCINCMPYHADGSEATWETSDIRAWLNGEFLETAFTDEERSHIASVTVHTEDNSIKGASGGNDTQDSIFLLSFEETMEYLAVNYDVAVTSYYSTDEIIYSTPTDYANNRGAYFMTRVTDDLGIIKSRNSYTNDNVEDSLANNCWYWLRSPGVYQNVAAIVSYSGLIRFSGGMVDYAHGGIRPAMWVNLEDGEN